MRRFFFTTHLFSISILSVSVFCQLLNGFYSPFFPACLWAMAAHLFTEYILCCTVKMPSTFSTSTHSNYSSTYFENQEPELELFVQQQRTLQACFSLRKEDKKSFFLKKCGFQKAVSTNCVTPDTTCTIQYLTLRRGKPRMEHKNASLCVCALVFCCVHLCLCERACLLERERA